MTTSAVIVPAYKDKMTISEQKSFRKCVSLFDNHDIILAAPTHLRTSEYIEIAEKANKKIRFVHFPSYYFSGLGGYNSLLLSRKFYKRFIEYDYLLIYQLDAFVFNNCLDEWCKRDYDYIGAPSFPSSDGLEINTAWIGNGGFSLRKTSSFLSQYKGLSWYSNYISLSLVHKEEPIKKIIEIVLLFGQAFILKHGIPPVAFRRISYEDYIWSHLGGLRIPAFNEAIAFSFEKFPSSLFEMNHQKLPFGCHGWEKYEYKSFWEKQMLIHQ